MTGRLRVEAKLAALVALGISAAACSTSEPLPLALALEDDSLTTTAAADTLPADVPLVPTLRPDSEDGVAETATPDTEQTAAADPTQPVTGEGAETPAETQIATAETAAPQALTETAEAVSTEQAAATEIEETEPAAQEIAQAPAEPAVEQPDPARLAAEPAPTKRKRNAFLSGLFRNTSSKDDDAEPASSAAGSTKLALVDPAPARKKRIITTARSTVGASSAALPGVRQDELFEITRRNNADDISDIDVNETSGSYQVASAAGLARLAPNGLRTQRPDVDVKCLKPELVRVLKTIERKFGRPVVVTSGYRSPRHNRRVRGARRSLHMYCAAADIQVEGISKWALARYLRSMPGRGGVGTYCHTKSVHIDIGPERDWNWRCRRRK